MVPASTRIDARPRSYYFCSRGHRPQLKGDAGFAAATAFSQELGEPRQGAERPSNAVIPRHGDPLNLIQFMLA
jgi:hypothetical protein